MTVDIGEVNRQTIILNNCSERLRSTKTILVNAKNDLNKAWNDESSMKVQNAINKQISNIDKIIGECSNIGNSMKQVAGDIEREERRKQEEELRRQSSKTYIVHAGDTLSKIARDNHTTVQALADYNNISNVNVINVGQQIKIP